jgi:hypothetical protein
MPVARFATVLKMAAPAAIFVLLPGLALAAACDGPSLNLADHVPALDLYLRGQADGEQFRKFFTPDSLITAMLLVWLIFSSGTRATLAAVAWFLALAAYSAYAYFTLDFGDSAIKAQIAAGCLEGTPRHILSNLGFAAIAGLLTWQRLRRQKSAVKGGSS